MTPSSRPGSGDADADAELGHVIGLVSMYRLIATEDFARYCGPFVGALESLHDAQHARGLRRQAKATVSELVEVCRRMTAVDQVRHRPALAWALMRAADDERSAKAALPFASQAVALLVAAAESAPDLRGQLAEALLLLSGLLRDVQEVVESRAARAEALQIVRELVAEDPWYRPVMIDVLLRVSLDEPDTGQTLSWSDEALRLARELATDDLDVGLPVLVRTLRARSAELAFAGDVPAARATFAEATAIQRHLPPPLMPEPGQVPQPPGSPEAAGTGPLDALIAISDVVCQLLRRGGAEPDALAALPRWTSMQVALLEERGLGAEAERADAEMRRRLGSRPVDN